MFLFNLLFFLIIITTVTIIRFLADMNERQITEIQNKENNEQKSSY
jgi:hypothetical protein